MQPRSAVEKPQFVVTTAAPPPTVAPTRAAPAVAIASEAAPPEAAPAAKPAETPPRPAAAEPSRTPVALASLDPPKPPPAPAKAPPAPTRASRGRSVSRRSAQPAPAPRSRHARRGAQPLRPRNPSVEALAPRRRRRGRPATANDASARWSVRGLVALAKGDLSSARLYLTRAAEAGDPRALVALADTYDPAMLAKLGVVVAPGDAQRAKEYLIKAAAAGVAAAKDRMAAIDSDARNVR